MILASSANEVVSEMQLPLTATHRVEWAGAIEGSKFIRSPLFSKIFVHGLDRIFIDKDCDSIFLIAIPLLCFLFSPVPLFSSE